MKETLTITQMIAEAEAFCMAESQIKNRELFGVSDGKAVGTYIEHKFIENLKMKYNMESGSSSSGIDLPSDDIQTDIKTTSIKQPQSSCPFRDATQKIFGLGYHLLLFVYDKVDDVNDRTALLNFVSCCFISKECTGDYTITRRLREMVKDNANVEDIVAYLNDRNIPADDITLGRLAAKILKNMPEQGYLTISNALQWRLQYQRVLNLSDDTVGITRIVNKVKKL